MSISRLPNGRLRAQVWDPAVGRNVSVARVLGLPRHESSWPDTRQGRRDAVAARERARDRLAQRSHRGVVTVRAFAERWISDPLFARPKASTMATNRYCIRPFVNRYGSLPMHAVDRRVVGEYLAGGRVNWTVPALRAMFSDAGSPKAGELVEGNPFSGLGISKGPGRSRQQPPPETMVRSLIEHAHRLAGPGLGAWLEVAAYTGLRPGELDALRWDAVDFQVEVVHVREQWSAGSRVFTLPKNGLVREAPLTAVARDALMRTARESEFCFTNLRGGHFTPSGRAYHWKAIREAAGYHGDLYLATRHFAGWFMVNVLELPSEDVAIALGHEDGGEQVRRVYGHRERDRALERVRAAYRGAGMVVDLETKRRSA